MRESAKLGVFWFVANETGEARLLHHACELAAGECGGDFINCRDSHYDVWSCWQRTGCPLRDLTRTVCRHEYEDWPRGRIIFSNTTERFMLYAAAELENTMSVEHVMRVFFLSADWTDTIFDDLHYRTGRAVWSR